MSSEDNLIFWPFLPIAWAKLSSLTWTSILSASSSKTIEVTSAGDKVFISNFAGSSSQTIISILSLPNSFETAWTLAPLIPTHAPTGSILVSFVLTAILDLPPGSLATALIWTTSSAISGTSSLNNSTNISFDPLDKVNCDPLFSRTVSSRIALTLSPMRYISPWIKSDLGRMASAPSPRSTMIVSLVTFFTVPVTRRPKEDLNFFIVSSLSASLTFWTMTCLAIWAAILPNSTFSIFSFTKSPRERFFSSAWSLSIRICISGVS